MVLELVLKGVVVCLVIAIVVFLGFKFTKKLILFLINSFLGLVVLGLINFLPFVNIDINVWSVLITVFGGIPGVILLIFLSYLGIAF